MQKRNLSFFVIIKAGCLLLILSLVNNNSLPAQTTISKRVPVIELKGNAYERGLQHGTLLKNEIAAIFIKWKANIRRMGVANPDSLLNAFLLATNFEPAIKKYTPSMLDEMKGIAEGSGQPYADVYAFQLVDEFWVYLDKKYNEGKHHCSGIGVPATANSPAYIAQNMELENYMHGGQVLLHLAATDKEPEQYILTCAGLLALNGMNASGIGMCMNTLMELQASADGLPVAFVIRGVLIQQKGKDALAFLKTVKHASGQNYILGIVDSVYDFEASANQVVRFLPKAGESSMVYHTNHALANHDVKPWHKDVFEKRLKGELIQDNSVIRFASLQQRLDKQPAAVSADIIKTTLRSKDNATNPVCVNYKEGGWGFTFSSILFTLGGKRSVQLTHGSPDEAEYIEYFFTNNK
ncbi:MAG TPA: C45 family autoproteolytic acyltransferase/hydrolase [Chitinophagaceae bacterium]|nr:C45 family autoproteolytic acyltransferase/hydrolase [Chitinophagaceae bacterium]